MARPLLVVEHVFDLSTLGVAVAPELPIEEARRRPRVRVHVRRRDGVTLVADGTFATASPADAGCVLLLHGVRKSEVLVGSEVWTVD